MQTFLPYADYDASAQSLDRLRLGKQRVEAYQIARVLLSEDAIGWKRHPAVLMWQGHVGSLCDYGLAMCQEWSRLGYVDNVATRLLNFVLDYELSGIPPEWIGWSEFHVSHQSNLIRKDSDHYRPQFGDVPDDLPYVWPVSAKLV